MCVHLALSALHPQGLHRLLLCRLKPDYADAYCDLGCTYCAMGEVEKAKKCFSTAVEHSPHHLEVRCSEAPVPPVCGLGDVHCFAMRLVRPSFAALRPLASAKIDLVYPPGSSCTLLYTPCVTVVS